jgi:hypothetical protein
MIMTFSAKEYKNNMDKLPSLKDVKKIMMAQSSHIPTRIKVGDRFYFDSNH